MPRATNGGKSRVVKLETLVGGRSMEHVLPVRLSNLEHLKHLKHLEQEPVQAQPERSAPPAGSAIAQRGPPVLPLCCPPLPHLLWAPSVLTFHVALGLVASAMLRASRAEPSAPCTPGVAFAFKIKTTQPTRYAVCPSVGLAWPGADLAVTVRLAAMAEWPPDLGEGCRDRLQVHSLALAPQMAEYLRPMSAAQQRAALDQLWSSDDAKAAAVETIVRCSLTAADSGFHGAWGHWGAHGGARLASAESLWDTLDNNDERSQKESPAPSLSWGFGIAARDEAEEAMDAVVEEEAKTAEAEDGDEQCDREQQSPPSESYVAGQAPVDVLTHLATASYAPDGTGTQAQAAISLTASSVLPVPTPPMSPVRV